MSFYLKFTSCYFINLQLSFICKQKQKVKKRGFQIISAPVKKFSSNNCFSLMNNKRQKYKFSSGDSRSEKFNQSSTQEFSIKIQLQEFYSIKIWFILNSCWLLGTIFCFVIFNFLRNLHLFSSLEWVSRFFVQDLYSQIWIVRKFSMSKMFNHYFENIYQQQSQM